MVLNDFFVIRLDVRPHANDDDDFSSILGALVKSLLGTPPKLLTIHMEMLITGIESCTFEKRLSRSGRVADYAAHSHAKVPQPADHPLFGRHPEHIQAGERHSAEAFRPSLLSSADSTDQQNGPYVHDCHLGAAARKMAEREGTHEGIRRNLDIGSSARVRCCKSKDRKYCRMI